MACQAAWAEAATVVAEVKRLQEGPSPAGVLRGCCPHRATCWFRGEGRPLMGPSGCEGSEQTCRCLGLDTWKEKSPVPERGARAEGDWGGAAWGVVCGVGMSVSTKLGPLLVTPASVD